MVVSDLQKHWDQAYNSQETTQLGWYEDHPKPSLKLIEKCKVSKDARILQVGVGSSTLVDALLNLGYNNIIASDISAVALEQLQKRLGTKKEKVQWIKDDLIHPKLLSEIEPIDLWHDRAVLHFFTNEEEQNDYFKLLTKIVKPKGYAIIATFNTEGATKCSGLNVSRYNIEILKNKLDSNFKLLKSFNHTYTMPSGTTRSYIYTLFQKN